MHDTIVLHALKAKEAYRQIGVDFVVAKIDKIIIPPEVGFAQMVEDGFLGSGESNTLSGYLTSHVQSAVQSGHVVVGFVDARLIDGGDVVNGFVLDYNPAAVVSVAAISRQFHTVTAHEVGHILTEGDHSPVDLWHRLMHDQPRYTHDHLDSKRFNWDEENKITSKRRCYVRLR